MLVRADVEAAQQNLGGAMRRDERARRIVLRLGVADTGERQEVDGDLPAGICHQLRTLLDVLQPIPDRPVVGAETLVVETEDADADRIQSGIDQAPEHVRPRRIGVDVDGRLWPRRADTTRCLHEYRAAGERLALATLSKADEVRLVRAQVPGRELSDLRRGRGEGESGLAGFDVAPLLRDANEAGGGACGGDTGRGLRPAGGGELVRAG